MLPSGSVATTFGTVPPQEVVEIEDYSKYLLTNALWLSTPSCFTLDSPVGVRLSTDAILLIASPSNRGPPSEACRRPDKGQGCITFPPPVTLPVKKSRG